MRNINYRLSIFVPLFLAIVLLHVPVASSAELTEEKVLKSIKKGQDYLIKEQQKDGSWVQGGRNSEGFNSLIVLAMLNSGMTIKDAPVQKALKYLRNIPENKPDQTYCLSLMISALVAAKDGKKDLPQIRSMTHRLLSYQVKKGAYLGSWGYSTSNRGADNSNCQYAILGLRDATLAGVKIDKKVWKLARDHWRKSQSADGGWGYTAGRASSTGSMTVAGISSLVITNSMLREVDDFDNDGQPLCCHQEEEDKHLKRGIKWIESHFSVRTNPNSRRSWLFYYLYGLERSGRLSGNRFYGNHDWYREGTHFIISRQDFRYGGWAGQYSGINSKGKLYGTSMALLFLSKGLSPVLFSKLKYSSGPENGARGDDSQNWNKHSHDIPNLTEVIKTRPGWPQLVTWQVIDLKKLAKFGSIEELAQSPIIYLSGDDVLQLSVQEISMLKRYIEMGGFIFSVANCQSAVYDDSFKLFIKKMFPKGEATLQKLSDTHAVYRSEYLLDPETVELQGVNFGCRTAIIYSPDDIACLWNKWLPNETRKRSVRMKSMVTRAIRIGVNVAAYATGKEPPSPLAYKSSGNEEGVEDKIERGLLQIAKLRHTGGWDTAPHAIRNLLKGLNTLSGLSASTKEKNLPATDNNIFKYPIIYMHGRKRFTMNDQEIKQLKEYLDNGGVLLADACCGDKKFDQGFRNLIKKIYPRKTLKRIPPTHEIFNNTIGFELKQVQRRVPGVTNSNQAGGVQTITGEPILEGIETDDRYSVIYSKYDISCALERQASSACSGYVEKDALKIAINMILYAMLQDVKYQKYLID